MRVDYRTALARVDLGDGLLRTIGIKILLVVPVLLIVSFGTFILVDLVPGDPAQQVLGPNSTAAPYPAGSSMFWPPRLVRLPPTNAISAKPQQAASSPSVSSSRTGEPNTGFAETSFDSLRRRSGTPR